MHRDLDPPYYTIRTDDGRVKQTEAEKLSPTDSDVIQAAMRMTADNLPLAPGEWQAI